MDHDLLVYGNDARLAGEVGPYLAQGVEAGEAVLTVLHAGHAAVVREALGPLRRDVTFLDRDGFYTRPEAALAGYDAQLRRLRAEGARAVRLAGELPAVDSRQDWDRWVAYDAILNRAMARHPVSILCVYDTRETPDDVVAAVRAAHPRELDDGWHDTPMPRPPEDLVREHTPAAAAVLTGLRDLPVDGGARVVRERLAQALSEAGDAEDKIADLLSAASEVLANAHRHGRGLTALRVGRHDDMVVCEVSDRGPGLRDPLAGFVPPGDDDGRGAGLWVARQLTRRLEAVATPEGSAVRLWA